VTPRRNMSTSPRNQNALTAGHVRQTSAGEPRRGRELWRLVNGDHVLVCEMLDDSPSGPGFELRLRKNGELTSGHRCDTKSLARYVAETFAQALLRTGWQASASQERP
jgi:hypothetical protein